MKILITGGAGFVGSHLCEHLLKSHKVICLDNLFSCRVKEENGQKTPLNIRHLFSNKNFLFINHDVRDPFPEEQIGTVDRIYHLACPASPNHYQKDKLMTVQTNVLGSINALNYAKKHGARILLASTSEVYGDPEIHPQTEEYRGNVNTQGPRACYDEGKRLSETLFHDYHHEKNVDVRIARIFNTYGPNMAVNDGRVISNFIVQALKGEDVTIYGSGEQTRSLQFVDDLIKGFVLLMESKQKNSSFPVNLGSQEEISINQLAQKIIFLTDSNVKIVYVSSLQDDPFKRRPDTCKAQSLLMWKPAVSLDEGLLKTIDYFKKVI